MVEIRWTDEAVKWLRDIYDYIAQDNTAAAAKVVSGIYDKVQLLYSPLPTHYYPYELSAIDYFRFALCPLPQADCCFSVSSGN